MTPNTAVQLTYLVTGIDLALKSFHHQHPDKDHPMTSAGGHIGMVCDMVPYAEDVVAAIDAAATQDFPGVFEYEVTENIGYWMGLQPVQPTRAEFVAQLKMRVGDFFNK